MRTRGDVGETLVEIMLTIVIIGLTVTALLSGLATISNAGTAQRNGVRADVVLRDYAETTKAATQVCVASATYSVNYVPPAGFTVSSSPSSNVCPAPGTPQQITLTVNGPQGLHETMQIKVRTP